MPTAPHGPRREQQAPSTAARPRTGPAAGLGFGGDEGLPQAVRRQTRMAAEGRRFALAVRHALKGLWTAPRRGATDRYPYRLSNRAGPSCPVTVKRKRPTWATTWPRSC